MDSEEAARLSAQQKHNQFMVFGKKYRYIEVFQCSGDDINLIINGGLQSPVNATKPALLSPGMLPQSQQTTPQTLTHLPPSVSLANSHFNPNAHTTLPPHYVSVHPQTNTVAVTPSSSIITPISHPPAFTMSTAAAAAAAAGMTSTTSVVGPQLALSLPHHSSQSLLAQQQAQFIAQQNLFARQAAAAAAVQNEQILYPNMSALLPPPTATAAAAPATHLALQHHHANAMAQTATPQYFFMPRPYLHPFQFGLVPSSIHPFAFSSANPNAVSNAAAAVAAAAAMNQQISGANAAAAAAAAAAATPIKRSYDSAFQQDSGVVNAAKRQVTRHPAGIYAPFYPPGM